MKHKSRKKNQSAGSARRSKNNVTVNTHEKIHVDPIQRDSSASDRDLKGMKQWVDSLSYESLINALKFSFQPDDIGSCTGDRYNKQSSYRGVSCGDSPGSTSHEFDLLMEMAYFQCPDNSDIVNNCHEWHRYMESRLDSPFLFRWINQEVEKGNTNTPKKEETRLNSVEDPLASLLGGGATGLPSELLDVLAKAGVKRSTSALLETFNEADEIDQAFESLEDCQSNMLKNIDDAPLLSSQTKYSVKMMQGKLDDGTLLGKGTTNEQQNADTSMLLWTALVRDRPLKAGEEEKSISLPKCALDIPHNCARNEQQRKKLVLDTLRLASRGKFLSNSGKQKQQYMSTWFNPTDEWFSLPMYLSSRFEASLWDAYLHKSTLSQMVDESKENSLVHSVKSLNGDAIDRVLCHAIGLVVRDEINKNNDILNSASATSDTIRETLLWKLICWSENGNLLSMTSGRRSDGFAVTPLLEWETPKSKLKSLVMNYLHEGLATEAERSLIQSIPAEERSKKPKASNKKKKRTKTKGNTVNQFAEKKVVECKSTLNRDDRSSDDDDDEPRVECIIHPNAPTGTITDFCESANSLDRSPLNENNSAKMTVLKVLDDILSNVFSRLGVQGEEFYDFTDAVTVKSRGESSRQIKSRSGSLDKTPSADDIEVATTAVISNKVGASVDAAMDFLQRSDHVRNHSLSSHEAQHLWASRSRRISSATGEHADTFTQKDVKHLKRSKSSGDGSRLKKPPIYPTHAPSRGESDSPWPSSDSPLLPQASQNETSIFDGAPLCLSGALDSGWNSVACKNQEDTSIFTDLLKTSERNTSNSDLDQINFVSSTAASIASSSSREDVMEDAGLDTIEDVRLGLPLIECDSEDANKPILIHHEALKLPGEPSVDVSLDDNTGRVEFPPTSPRDIESPPPSAPPTPPPQLSPILVSLADLGKLREDALSVDIQEKTDGLPKPPLVVSSTPPKAVTPTLVSRSLKTSLSRDDLRSIDEYQKPPRRDRDDHHTMIHRQVDALLSYRNVVAQTGPRKPPSVKSFDGKQKHRDDSHPMARSGTRSIRTTRSHWPPGPEFPSLSSSVTSMPSYKEPMLNKVLTLDVVCARSESGLDGGVDDASHCNVVIPRNQTDDTMTKDGATTISSVHSGGPPAETENISTLKEERNSYRDMCLTLGAENAKLRNLLASKTCTPLYHPTSFPQETSHFNPNLDLLWPAHNHFPNQFSTHSIVAMSDAGHKADYDSSAMSEDDTDNMHPSVVAIGESQNSIAWQARGDSVTLFSRRTSGGGTYAESDLSLDHNIGQESQFSGLHRVHHPQDSFYGPIPLHGMESRLGKDINRYMLALKSQLKKTEGNRLRAVEAMTKTVKALWPRAQIKMYGSHVTNLCLPSSDVDFVISLPAVHKNAPATAPGDLEGRNAIIETNQKVLARKLKSESWLDQRTIKVIERTAVPVIKVSTKGSRSRAVQLDLSFDAKEHHGLEALNMIQHILEQLPMVRPLVLVLKQFLLDRGLLTAYTGGLSSYCLFLMVARYCQEQAPSWNDCGSLLMGLLDFYGNFFDARTTGISVRTRQYFFRSQEVFHPPQNISEAQGWDNPHQTQFPDLTKRNSFSSKPHRFQHGMHRQFSFQNTQTNIKSGKFDPIWVEDPLNPGNNVGRNAFRIFQVQRAFSDAHRALVASLEWDINSEFGDDDGEYPLLKCLLQNEDVFYSKDI